MDPRRLESRRLGSEARIHGVHDPNTSFRESLRQWEEDLNKRNRRGKDVWMYILLIIMILFLFYVLVKYALSFV
jgi:hypothetical protein